MNVAGRRDGPGPSIEIARQARRAPRATVPSVRRRALRAPNRSPL